MERARQALEAQVLERAAKDSQFRERLKHDPRGAVARDFGVQIPPDVTVEVLEETPLTVYLVLPAVPAQRGEELSNQDLEAVAGGWSSVTNDCGNSCIPYRSCGCVE